MQHTNNHTRVNGNGGRPHHLSRGVREVSSLFGVSEQTIHRWARQGIIAQGPQGYDPLEALAQKEIYDLESQAKWYGEQGDVEDSPPRDLPANMAFAWENARLTRIRVEIERIKLETLKGEVVRREDVAKAVGAVFAAVRGQVLSMADQLAPRLFGMGSMDAMRDEIRGHCERVLAGLTEARVVKETEGGEDDGA